jgi:hypothetical protein
MKLQRTASVVVCDEILFGLTGKSFLQGLYTGDITIPGDQLSVNQLVFYFTVETPKSNPFKKITLRVVPPYMPAAQYDVPFESVPEIANKDRPKMIVRAPLLMQQLLLRPGKVETTVLTESEELDAGGIWVTSVPKFPSVP